jgi:hypothetical protein
MPERTRKRRKTLLKQGKSLTMGNPLIVSEWDTQKNVGIDPDGISVRSHILIWWKCKDGHSWKASPNSRARGRGCPVCYRLQCGDLVRARRLKKTGISLATAHPGLLTEWDYNRNSKSPDQVSPKSGYKAHWVCKYGHRWLATIVNRTHAGSNCPECNPQSSRLEIFILCELRFIYREVEWRRILDGYECDVFVPDLGLGIEVDGEYWHRNKENKEQQKSEAIAKQGFHLIRVRDQRLGSIDGDVVWYKNGEPPIQIVLRLFKEIDNKYPNKRLKDYIALKKQQNESEYQQILARLPAPPLDKTFLSLFPLIAKEWDFDKNYPFTPDLFPPYSNQKFSWICDRGHHWVTSINNRVGKLSGCPICYRGMQSEKTTEWRLKKSGSLEQNNPVYLSQWDYEKNGELRPNEVAPGSRLKVWWKCSSGHSYQQGICEKKSGSGCPFCSGKSVCIDNCLATVNPKLANEWHSTKNGSLTPKDVTVSSGKKVWWLCKKGHEWCVRVANRKQSNCPYCAGKAVCLDNCLATVMPKLVSEWHPTKNGSLTPKDFVAGSHKKVWWLCGGGHSYLQMINDRKQGHGCPKCRYERNESLKGSPTKK